MTYRILMLRQARADIVRLEAWLSRFDIRAAVRAGDAIDAGITSLTDLPLRNAVDEHGYRHHLVRFGKRGYVVRYEVTHDEVRILRIWHGREQRT